MIERIPYAEITGTEVCANCGHVHDFFDQQRRFGWPPKRWCVCPCTWPYRVSAEAIVGDLPRKQIVERRP